jgi:hypothetical protein
VGVTQTGEILDGPTQTGVVKSVTQSGLIIAGPTQTGENADLVEETASAAPEFSGITSWNWSAKSLSGLSDGDPVTTWTDRHSSDTAVQATTANQPTKQTVSSLTVIDFDGVDDFLDASAVTLGTEATYFIVARYTAGAAQGAVFGGLASTDRNILYNLSASGIALFAGSNRAASFDVRGSWTTFECRFDNPRTDSQLITDGVVRATGSPGTQTASSGLRFGAFYTGGAPFDGEIAEIVVYASELTSAQTTQVNNWLSSEWGTL